MSLLLANGHTEANGYPIAMIWDEARLVGDRLNGQMATEAVLTQMAVSSVLSKKAGKEFDKMIKRMSED